MRGMRIVRLLLIVSLIWLSCPAPPEAAVPAPVAQNVVIVTIDGFRWQELFGGADQAYFKKSSDGKPTDAERRFLGGRGKPRRQGVVPVFWDNVAGAGGGFGGPAPPRPRHPPDRPWVSSPG